MRRGDLALLAFGCGEAISFATFFTALARFGGRLALFPLLCFDVAVLPAFTFTYGRRRVARCARYTSCPDTHTQ